VFNCFVSGQGGLDRLALTAHLVAQLVLGPGVSPGEELVEHVHRLIDGVAVALPEEAYQPRRLEPKKRRQA
jgi:hypothetical protein